MKGRLMEEIGKKGSAAGKGRGDVPDNGYEKADKATRRLSSRLRLTVLLVVLAFSTVIGILHQKSEAFRTVGVDALCPFGGLESIYYVITAGAFLKRVALGSLIVLLATIIIGLIFRRSFCGQICPLGTLQELAARLGKAMFGRNLTMPAVVDRPARYLKYLILLLIVGFSTYLADMVIRPYDPWVAYHHLTSAEVFSEFGVGLAILAVTLVGSLLYDRFFCKYLCPMGGFLAIFGRIGLFGVKRDAGTCIDCGLCDKACPVNLEVSNRDEVRDAECINCNECINACPVKDALYVGGPTKHKLTANMALGLVVLIFAGVLGLTTLTGDMKWMGETIDKQMEQSGGTFDPMMIKGYMTFSDVEKDLGIPHEELKQAFGLSDSDFSKPLREFASRGFETAQVRDYVSQYLEAKGVQIQGGTVPN